MTDIKKQLTARFRPAIRAVLGEEFEDLDPLLNVTTTTAFGDYQANLAMSLAKRLSRNPREIAAQLVAELNLEDICDRVEIAGPGFINLFLSADFINAHLELLSGDPALGITSSPDSQRIVIDYSAPNIAKEMHVGHLRSTVIGDALTRVLMRQGHTVIRQNHMGDWGTQFGMLIEYLLENNRIFEGESAKIDDLEQRYRAAKRRFDTDAEFRERSRKRVVALQSGDPETLRVWQFLVDESIKHFNDIYSRLGVLLQESDNCPESFYNPMLPEVVSHLESQGLLEISDDAGVVYPEGFHDRENRPLPMIVRKADGGFLYATTDLAAVCYRVKNLKAERIIYVTDARQSQHFAMLFAVVRLAGWAGDSVRLDHVPFGTVLGADRKPFKTREGGTIKLVDLLDEAHDRAMAVLGRKNPELSGEERARLSQTISIGALKYADLSSDRLKDYVFDWDRMLALEGNTAPYLLNAYVRILSIFRKGKLERGKVGAEKIAVKHPAEKALAMQLLQYASVIESVADRLEPHRLCTYLYELSSLFHTFYESCPILRSDVEEELRRSRLALSELVARHIEDGLGLLGIECVDRM